MSDVVIIETDIVAIETPVEIVLEVSGPQGPAASLNGDASLLTNGTLPDARLSAAVQASLAKANSASQPGHTHLSTDISDFAPAVAAVSPPANLNYQTAVADTVVSTPVGGATAQPASTWKARTISQALDTILFPTVPPFISTPKSASLLVSGPTGVQEVGSSVVRNVVAVFDRGRITNGDGSLGPGLVGNANEFPVYSGTGIASTSNSALGSIAVVLGSNQWSVSITHGAGSDAYFDNKNNASTALDGSRAAGTVTASTTAFTGVYPWYYIKSPVTFTAAQFGAAITALGNGTSGTATNIHASANIAKVVADAGGTLSVPYNVSNQFVGVAHDSALTSKTAYFVSALNSGSITGPFKTEETQNSVAQASTSPRWTRDFKILVSKNPLTDSATTLELRNAL